MPCGEAILPALVFSHKASFGVLDRLFRKRMYLDDITLDNYKQGHKP
jgi:hypothetical protein